MASEEAILEALRQVKLPGGGQDLVTLGLVKKVKEAGGIVAITIEKPAIAGFDQATYEALLRDAVKRVAGAQDVAVLFTESQVPQGPPRPAGIKHIIAIGSGKGGVGKSTVSANLALALASTGARVGLLDADIYGPSIPFMMGASGEKPAVKDEKLQPIVRHGVKLMSMGFLLPNPEDPVVWRGPMLASALKQFIKDVAWGELDYLLIDLPPGTGDVPLTMVQSIPLSGAVIVITPQPVAAAIGIKTLRMLQQSQVPILGMIENMSHFTCPECRHETAIFDRGGGHRTSEQEHVPFLGEIPLDPKIRQSGDVGRPVFVDEPNAPQAKAFQAIAEALAKAVAAPTPGAV